MANSEDKPGIPGDDPEMTVVAEAGSGEAPVIAEGNEDKTLVLPQAPSVREGNEDKTLVIPRAPGASEGNEDETRVAQPEPVPFEDSDEGTLVSQPQPGLYTAARLTTQAIGDDATQVKTHPGISPLTGRSYVPHSRNVIKDRFVLESRLGKGGMGQVYRARDLRK
ncbi:MAG TPA: hypothetical protein VIC02_08930, partial [Kineobactrum sp.]